MNKLVIVTALAATLLYARLSGPVPLEQIIQQSNAIVYGQAGGTLRMGARATNFSLNITRDSVSAREDVLAWDGPAKWGKWIVRAFPDRILPVRRDRGLGAVCAGFGRRCNILGARML